MCSSLFGSLIFDCPSRLAIKRLISISFSNHRNGMLFNWNSFVRKWIWTISHLCLGHRPTHPGDSSFSFVIFHSIEQCDCQSRHLSFLFFYGGFFFWVGRYIPLWRNKGSYNLTMKIKCAFAQSCMCSLKRESSNELNEGLTRSIVS